MFKFIRYKTPQKFVEAFTNAYSYHNLLHIKLLAGLMFIFSFCTRVISIIYYDDLIKLSNHKEYSRGNWFALSSEILFIVISTWALRSNRLSVNKRRLLTIFFVFFVLFVTFYVSYTASLHNTKNTLTIVLLGIVTVSLFFVLDYLDIVLVIFFIILLFSLGVALSEISVQQKIQNMIVAFVLGFMFLFFSRYSYYFKSQHFVKIKELEEKNNEIEALNTQQNSILGYVAHDLRAPLNNIEALSSLLLLENVHHKEVTLIQSSALQAKTIINDLIEVIRADKTNLETKKTELASFLITICNKWNINEKARKIIFNTKAKEVYANFNASKLERVLDNLIGNALKFSEDKFAVEVNLSQNAKNVIIEICDKGIGVPINLQEIIFHQFSESGRLGLRGEKSLGLGLHISKQIMEQHSGEITIKSIENKGSTFTITLPIS